jgi:hypothetical protein
MLNYAIAIERDTARPPDDATSYTVTLTQTVLQCRQVSTNGVRHSGRIRYQGVVPSIDEALLEVGNCLDAHSGLGARIEFRNSVPRIIIGPRRAAVRADA